LNRKLLLLDVLLAAVVVYAGFRLKAEWRSAKVREAATLHRPARTPRPQEFTPLPTEPPVLAGGYANIAQKMLFDKSRDPNVVIEVAPPPPKPPMPPLPVFHGVMNLGEGPIAILSVNKDAAHQGVRPGETIGQFKLIDVNSEEMTLEWQGEVVRRSVNELSARAALPAEAPARTDNTPAAAPAPATPPPPVKTGPGEVTQFGFKTCQVNDGHPEGAVLDGYKKVMHQTPFGQSCTYEPLGK
jgi:hypothetical protein